MGSLGLPGTFSGTNGLESLDAKCRGSRLTVGLLSCFILVLACALRPPVHLSAQNPQGSLLVAVEDATGGRIAGAGVTVALEKSAVTGSGNSDTHGEARFDSLPPGTYMIAVRATGFVEKTTPVTVSASSHATFPGILRPQTLKQSVQVRDRGPS